MIKINLLPRTINEKKVVKNTAIMFGALVVVVALIGVLYAQLFLVPQVQAEEQLATQTETLEAEVNKIETDTKGVRDKIPPLQNKLTFIKNVLDYNLKYPKLYEDIAKWTYEKVAYMGMGCDGAEVTMAARTKSLDDLGRFLLNMYRATDLFTEVTISGVPGYPMAGNTGGGSPGMQGMQGAGGGGPQANLSGIDAISAGVQNAPPDGYIGFMVKCKLKTPITAPAFAGAQAAPGTPGAPATPPTMPPAMPMPPPGS
jgi:Tfp pilus assembly protein PilN